ncbi:MAG: hypothetical protein AAAFM81_10995, partial [Pseudomonadota bacterium]
MKIRVVWTLLLCLAVFPAAVATERDDIARVIVVGDVHGDYQQFVAVLRDAGLVNRRGKWPGARVTSSV